MDAGVYNVYSDESCHLTGANGYMVFGALWCTPETSKSIADEIRLLKQKHSIAKRREIKWTKVSPSKVAYYKELLSLFIDNDDLRFRAVLVDKATLRHEDYKDGQDGFYYRMQYLLMRNIAEKRYGEFRMFLDYKDTSSHRKSIELSEYLGNTAALRSKKFRAQPIKSHEVAAMQLTDLIMGVVMYANRPLAEQESPAKASLVRHLQDGLGQKLTESTPYATDKCNLFFWERRR